MTSRLPPDFVFSDALPPAAIAAFRALRAENTYPDIEPIMRAVDYPNDSVGPRADQLTPAQRAVAELITELDITTNNNSVDKWMPRARADRRSWLGLDAPQPLDREYTFTLRGESRTEPAWRALKLLRRAEAQDGDKTLVAAWIGTLPVAERLAMWGQLNLRWPQPWNLDDGDFFDPEDRKLVVGLRDEGKDWAPAYADQVLAERAAGRGVKDSRLWTLLALVRAKVPIEPRWDTLVPDASDAIVAEILRAIPAERRGDALATAMRRMRHPAYALRAAKRHLSRAPSRDALLYAIECAQFGGGSYRTHIEALADAVAKHPELVEAMAPTMAKLPKPIVLRTLALRDVAKEGTKATFSPTDEAQLLAAGKGYFGKAYPLETLLSSDPRSEESLRHVLTYRAIGDAKGKHIYDMWEYGGDSGSVFRVGTTTRVASVIQGSVDRCRNEGLRDALELVMREAGPTATPPEPSKPKGAGKKAPAASRADTKSGDTESTVKPAPKKRAPRKPKA